MAHDPLLPHTAAREPRSHVLVQGLWQLFLQQLPWFTMMGVSESGMHAVWAYLCMIGVNSFAGQQVRFQVQCLAWTTQRPICRTFMIAPRPSLQATDPQLYAWRFWYIMIETIANPRVMQPLPGQFRFVCYQCATQTLAWLCSTCHDTVMCQQCIQHNPVCRRCQLQDPGCDLEAEGCEPIFIPTPE